MLRISLASSGRQVNRAKRGPGHVLAFATLVAQPGSPAMLIDRENACAGFVAIAVAVERGQAFAVEVADDVLAIDQDDLALAGALDRLATELREAGHVPVLTASGREGHRHLLARVRDRAQWLDRARELGFPGDALRYDSRRLRPPLAPHRSGLPVALLSPADPVEAMVALAPRAQAGTHRLSRAMYELLRKGDTRGRYKSRSEMALGLTLAMVNRGWSEPAIYKALMNPKNAGGAKVPAVLSTKSEQAARRYVTQLYRKATQRVRQSPPTHPGAVEARTAVERLREQADRQPWPGKGGASARGVLQAHLDIAAALGSETYTASNRELAERAGIERKTVGRSHQRLIGQGWLDRIERGCGAKPSSWRLPRRKSQSPFPLLEGGCERNGAFYLRSRPPGERDLFRWRGLGSPGAGLGTERVFSCLRGLGTATTGTLAASLGMKLPAVRWHLRRLHDDGLAEATAGVWALVSDVDAAVVRASAVRGTLGAGLYQRARHREERERWRETLRTPRQEAMAERQPLRVKAVDIARLVKVAASHVAQEEGARMVNGGMVKVQEAMRVELPKVTTLYGRVFLDGEQVRGIYAPSALRRMRWQGMKRMGPYQGRNKRGGPVMLIAWTTRMGPPPEPGAPRRLVNRDVEGNIGNFWRLAG